MLEEKKKEANSILVMLEQYHSNLYIVILVLKMINTKGINSNH